ncbi:transcriptional regulator domain-containing protein [Janthinobacterium lividum]|uniref:transcriptional regulator domain-containing protein n=1 Tax=Janthinobacterium sp. FT68W TaxID=2654255 RepID=UPI001264D584|nr:DUF6499 domain-containing protein [Janthinobacterium sp. FT68W]KAB8054762.1 DUF2285 domain-containing protein [Janthinobacterium sp. FT68W]
MQHPNWEESGSYAFDPKKLSYRGYAWEFLRRNPNFQNESDQALLSSSQRECEQVATKYGLRDLVPSTHIYHPGKPELVWLAETICEPLFAHRKGQKNVIHTQRPGEVALIFDLDATVSSGPAAIDAFLWDARRMLMAERMRFIETLPEDETRPVRVKSPSIRKSKLFDWLRTYDAVEYMGISQKDVARVLYPDDFVPDKFTKKTRELAAQKRVSDDRKRAMSLVDNEYLALVPLDYLQDKSKR